LTLSRLRRAVAVAAMVFTLAACTPQEVAFFFATTDPYGNVLSDERLAALRQCESSGNYQAISASGRFRGAYQFDQLSWNGVAERHFPWLGDNDPAAVEPAWQDAMARALWSERGSDPWPSCGKRL
jgi:hypothetical protein